jgi:hypothetical protein
MSKFHSFKIVKTGDFGYSVFMDGQKLEGVTTVALAVGVDRVPGVVLTFLAEAVEADLGEGEIVDRTALDMESRTYARVLSLVSEGQPS